MGEPIGIRDSRGLPQTQTPIEESAQNEEARGSAVVVAAALLEGSLLVCGLLWLIRATPGRPSSILIAAVVALAVISSTVIVLAITHRGGVKRG